MQTTVAATPAWFAEFSFFAGQRVARLTSDNIVHHHFGDHLGSAAVVFTQGAYDEDLVYYPYGGLAPGNQEINSQAYKFTGKERDAESGLDEFGARYYSSKIGRFMIPDWAEKPTDVPYAEFGDPQSLNLYGYVRNNPLSHADTDGHCCDEELHDLGVAAQNALDHTMAGFIGLVIQPDKAIEGIGSSIKTAAIAYGTESGREQLANQLSDPSTARQVVFEGVLTGGIMVAPGASTNSAPIQTLGDLKPEVPTSIPAGPSARPTAAQQTAINEMGEAHGCHTCGATTPGTKSGNWVGDHQPSTALNTSGGPQVYKPQCLQCSRVQGGQVAAQVRAAAQAAAKKKPDGQ